MIQGNMFDVLLLGSTYILKLGRPSFGPRKSSEVGVAIVKNRCKVYIFSSYGFGSESVPWEPFRTYQTGAF